MRKRILMLLSCSMLLATLVTGCGVKAPTPEELLSKAWGSEPVDSVDMDLDFSIDARMDMSELTGEDATMNMSIDASINIKSDEDANYMDGNVGVNILGMDVSEPIRAYTVKSDDSVISYMYNSDEDYWSVEKDTKLNSFIETENLSDLKTDMFTSLTMDEVTEESIHYILRGTVNYKDLADKMGMSMDEMLGDVNTEGINMDNFEFDTVLTFDKELGIIQQMEFVINPDSLNVSDTEGIEFSAFNFVIKINQINGVDVEVPSDIIENAVDLSYVDEDIPVTEFEEDDITIEEPTTLAQYILGMEYAYEDDIKEILNLYYSTLPSEDVIWSFLTFFNNYTASELCEYMDLYSSWSLEDKIALGILIDIGALDLETTQAYGVDVVEMQSIIDEYVTSLR